MFYAETSKKIRALVLALVQAEAKDGFVNQSTPVNRGVSMALAVAWLDAVREEYALMYAASPALSGRIKTARNMMAEEHSYLNGIDPICLVPGMKPMIVKVDDKDVVAFDYNVASATPLSAYYLDKVCEIMDAREKAPKIITNVYKFGNGQTMVFDQFGKQMPEYQGITLEVEPKIREAGFTGTFEDVVWKGGSA